MKSALAAALLVCLCLSARAQSQDEPLLGDASAVLQWAKLRAASMPSAARAARGGTDNPWKRAATPAPGRAESIGAYAAGCLRGGEELPLSGPGFEVMRPSRRRFYGHPRLIAFVRALGSSVSGAGLGTLLVGDLAQPRGGPTLSGHASHQTGLDVDVWYRQAKPGERPSAADRETWTTPEMVVPDFVRLARSWNPRELEVLRLAASDPGVERIFVNPIIKQEACRLHGGASWLGKLRPWWGHDDHFHARLTCTPGDRHCANPADPIPPGDGCDGVAAWLTPAKRDEARRQRTEPGEPPKMPALPPQCRQVLAD